MPVYELLATQVPPPPVAAAWVDPTGEPPVSESFATGDKIEVAGKLNRNFARLDAMNRAGAGAIAVGIGLDLVVDSGLAAHITPGQTVDGLATLPAEYDLDVADDAATYVWLSPLATPAAVIGDTTSPGEGYTYLGALVADDGAVKVDYSGRMEMRGGVLWRRTADPGEPGDTPPAGIKFLHTSGNGIWLWDGEQYWYTSSTNAPDIGKVRTNADDVTAGYLEEELVAGDNIMITVVTDEAGNKTLRISAASVADTKTLKATDADTGDGSLQTKLVDSEGNPLTAEDIPGGAGKRLRLPAGGGLTTEPVEGYLDIELEIGETLQIVWDHSDDAEFSLPLYAQVWAEVDGYVETGITIRPIHQTTDGDITDGGHYCVEVENIGADGVYSY
jgi:hypothetical protein